MADDPRKEPLLPPPAPVRGMAWLLAMLALAHVLVGTLERLAFARMATSWHAAVVTAHTLLAALSSLLFVVLRLARSQREGPGVPESLMRPQPRDVATMAALDALHSLLALDGGSVISGVMQCLLVQARPHVATRRRHPARAPVAVPRPRSTPSSAPHPRTLPAQLTIPAVCALDALGGGRPLGSAQRAGALLIGAACAVLLLAPLAGVLPVVPPADPSPALGRLLFALAAVFAAASATFKRRVLSRAPVDPWVLNSWLSPAQLVAGLIIGPVLMLLLHDQPVADSFGKLSDAFDCIGAEISADVDAARTCRGVKFSSPLLYFIASCAFSAAAATLLRLGGDAPVSLGSALVVPAALLAFINPLHLPQSLTNAAPGEPLGVTTAAAVLLTGIGLACHTAHVWRASGGFVAPRRHSAHMAAPSPLSSESGSRASPVAVEADVPYTFAAA